MGDAWLSALPQGPDLAAPAVTDAGQAGIPVAGRTALVGQVYATGTGPGAQYYVELRDGLAPVSATQADLLLAEPALRYLYIAGQPTAIPVTAAVAATTRSTTSLALQGLPASPPSLVGGAAGSQLGACESYSAGGSFLPSVWTVSVPASSEPQAPSGTPADASGTAVAAQVQVPPGGGALVQAVAAPGASGGTLYVVTDEGVKYPLPDASVLTALGLSGITPARLPSALLDLMRTGPTLNPQAALTTVAS